MRILMVSMFANHFFNWADQLKDSGHEILWIDVFDNGEQVERINWMEQTVNWKRKLDYPGRQFIKKNFHSFYKILSRYFEKSLSKMVEEKIIEFKPDVVQSFVLFSACTPILVVMQKYPEIKWIYSAWGNDLFYFQNDSDYLKDIKRVLPRVDYMFADCKRDNDIAVKYGFQGEFLGDFPGGGGYVLYPAEKNLIPSERDLILIKGYQALFGECIPVLKAIEKLQSELSDIQVKVFGADPEVVEYVKKAELNHWNNFEVLEQIGRVEVLDLMNKAKIYIGNSISDGMPNTLLEAIISGAFPIQSDPGGATSEIIEDGLNGLLILNPMNVDGIKNLILKSLEQPEILEKAFHYNLEMVRPKLERTFVKQEVLKKYEQVEKDLNMSHG
jgi:hypothetical protein